MMFSRTIIYSVLLGLGLLFLLGYLLFGSGSTDLTCVRASAGLVECSLVRNTALQKMSPIKIHAPLAVDVIEREGGHHVYSAEIRTANILHGLPILSTYDYRTAQDAANEVNAFLKSSNQSALTIRFPKKRSK